MITPQAIFFDIDGTLVSFKTHSIPASTKTAIRQLKEKGIKVIISTGRGFPEINNLEDLKFDGYSTANGTVCLDSTGKMITQHLIPEENLRKFASILKERPFPCLFMTKNGGFFNLVTEQIQTVYQLINLPIPPLIDVMEIIGNGVFQISAFVDSEQETELLNHVLTRCDSSRWHPSFTDFHAKNISKATGIDFFMAYFGMEGKPTMAFGDGGNDISMLKHATIGIAMGNAAEHIKAVADYVTDSVEEDGIMNALKYFNILS